MNQFTVIENKCKRRPDVVVFVNGLPLGVIELKNPGDENATLDGAFNQLQTYKAQIGSLFRANALLIISDGMQARVGSLTADRERFMPWRTIDGDDLAPKGVPELETLLKGVFEKRRFLDLVKDFIVFTDAGSGVAKVVGGEFTKSCGNRSLVQPSTVPSPLVGSKIYWGYSCVNTRFREASFQSGMRAVTIVIMLEIEQLRFQVSSRPE